MGFIDKTRQLIRNASTFFSAAPASLASSTALQREQLDVAIDQWRFTQLAEDSRLRDPRSLNRFEHRAFSQDGSDGILAEIFRRIGEGDRYFVEFGVGNGLENNTALLLSQGWNGLWIDGDNEQVATARNTFSTELSSGRLTLLSEFITAENIEQLFESANAPAKPSLISIDIDGNDYWGGGPSSTTGLGSSSSSTTRCTHQGPGGSWSTTPRISGARTATMARALSRCSSLAVRRVTR